MSNTNPATLLDQLTQEELQKLEQQALITLIQAEDSPRSFSAFFRLIQGDVLQPFQLDWIEKAYEAHENKQGILQRCARETGKSTVFRLFVAYRIGKEPSKTNVVVRVNDQKAAEMTASIATLIEHNPYWKMAFPGVVPDPDRGWGANGYHVRDASYSTEEWSAIRARDEQGATFVGYGWTSGSIIGSRFSGIILVDDIHDEGNTQTAKLINAVKTFLTDTLAFCIMDDGWEVFCYTPWKSNDAYAYLESTGEYIINSTPALIEATEQTPGAKFWKQTEGVPSSGKWYVLTWEDKWSFRRLGRYHKKSGVVGFARMMRLDLTAAYNVALQREWVKEYPKSEIKPSWAIILGIDYASVQDKLKDKDRDYFALAAMAVIPTGGLILIDGYRGQVTKTEALSIITAWQAVYPNTIRIAVESIGKGQSFFEDLLFINDVTGKPLPLFPITHHRHNKGDRFENYLAPRFQANRIWIADEPTPFIKTFIDEWGAYPNGAHDDVLDAVYMASFGAEEFIPVNTEKREQRKPKASPWVAFGRR